MANVPTDRRAVVRVQLRLGTLSDGPPTVKRLGGYHVMVVGEAKHDEWPSFLIGDLEGVVWTTPRQVPQVVENLRACEGVVDAKGA